MNFFKDYRKRLIWLGIFLVAMCLSQVPIVTLMLLQKTQLGSIWSSLIVGLVYRYCYTLFIWCSQK
jgi:hypothetical protein